MKVASKILSTILLILVIGALILFGVPRLFGVQMFNVTSGSMQPSYMIGDLVYAVPTSADQIQPGDTITFTLGEDTVATHRVVRADHEKQEYITKGDANDVEDGTPVQYQNIIGVVKFYVPKVGEVLNYISSRQGRIISLTILAASILLTIIFSINGKPDDDQQERITRSKEGRRTNRQEKAVGRSVRQAGVRDPPEEELRTRRSRSKSRSEQEDDEQIENEDELEKRSTKRRKGGDMPGKRVPPQGWGSGKTKLSRQAKIVTRKPTAMIVKSIAIFVCLMVGATTAYLTIITNEKANAFAVGAAKMTIDEPNVADKNNVPWGVNSKNVKLSNKGDQKSVVRVMFVPTVSADGANTQGIFKQVGQPVGTTMSLGDINLHFEESFSAGQSTNWFYKNGYFYYKKVLSPEEQTNVLLKGVSLKNSDAEKNYKDKRVNVEVLSDIIQIDGNAPSLAWGVTVSGDVVSP